MILGVPVIDTLFAIIRRARSGTGISTADKGHLHHRLMRLGHGHRRSVFILWSWTAILSGFVLWPIYSGSGDGIVPFGIAAILLSLFTMFHPGVRIERRRVARDEARDARRRAGLERGSATGPLDPAAATPAAEEPAPAGTAIVDGTGDGSGDEGAERVAGDRPRA